MCFLCFLSSQIGQPSVGISRGLSWRSASAQRRFSRTSLTRSASWGALHGTATLFKPIPFPGYQIQFASQHGGGSIASEGFLVGRFHAGSWAGGWNPGSGWASFSSDLFHQSEKERLRITE